MGINRIIPALAILAAITAHAGEADVVDVSVKQTDKNVH